MAEAISSNLWLYRWMVCGLALCVAACATVPSTRSDHEATAAAVRGPSLVGAPRSLTDGWRYFALPGKARTTYIGDSKDGRAALRADADTSAGLWRRSFGAEGMIAPTRIRFSWQTDQLINDASVASAEHEDAVARIVLGFGGDHERLSPRNRMVFELARALTGEEPPFATLMYVWDSSAPVGSVIISPRTDRVRKIVVESGPAHLRQWRDYERDVRTDFHLAFGEDPGPLLSVALMTDTDNTRSKARTWYGDLTLD